MVLSSVVNVADCCSCTCHCWYLNIHIGCCNVCMLVNKRLDDWISVDLMDLSRLEAPKKENKTPMKVMNGSRPSSPDRELVHFLCTCCCVNVLSAMAQCPSVCAFICHMTVLYRSSLMVFWYIGFPQPMCCVLRRFGYLQNLGYFLLELLYLEVEMSPQPV